MKTHEKRRGRGLFASLAADPYRKLAAIALAVGLWFYLDSQIVSSTERELKLEAIGPQRIAGTVFNSRLAVVLPTDQVIGKRFLDGDREIPVVKVKLSGPRYRIDALANEALDLQVSSFLGIDWSKSKRVDFQAVDIPRNLNALQGVFLTMEPPRVTLEVEKIDALPLPLNLDRVELLVDEQLGARLRRDTVVFSPDEARLLGPASSLAQFQALGSKPLVARLRSVAGERQLNAILELAAPAELGLRLAETPSMTIQVLPVTRTFELDLPLRVDDLALPADQRGLYRPETVVQRVGVKAGGQLLMHLVALSGSPDKRKLEDWASAHLRLDVWIPPLEPGTSYGPEIVRPARLFLRGPMQASVDQTECDLDKPVSILLRRTP